MSWFTFDFRWFWLLVYTTVPHVFGKADVDFFFWDPLFPTDDPSAAADGPLGPVRSCSGTSRSSAVFVVFKLWVLIYLVSFGNFFATILGG